MESIVTVMLVNLAVVIKLMVVGWLCSLVLRNVTVVDSLWGLGFVIVAWLTFFLSDGYAGRRWLLAVLVTVWGARLSIYLTLRNWGKGEDPRYGQWRARNGPAFWWHSLFKVFLLQALFMWVIALALQYAQSSPAPAAFTLWDGLGAGLWLAGFVFEAVGDAQLAAFKADPKNKGRVMDRGLWAYSRHPNYFGEVLLWWGIFIIALSAPGAWWTIVSPMVITTVLLKMTGVPLTEKGLIERRPGYREYIAKTNAIFPWFPRKAKR